RDQLPLGPRTARGAFRFDVLDKNGQLVERRNAVLEFVISPDARGFTLTGSVGGGGANGALDVYRVQQRLKFLGFPASTGDALEVNGQVQPQTETAIRLFQAVVSPNQIAGGQNPSADPSKTSSGLVGPASQDLGWLNAGNAPHWVRLIDPDFYLHGNF